jgi:peptidoglycan hydrolase-like protein with peptidoglycan-binding domain
MLGPDVEYVQQRLSDLGFYDGEIDGVYDLETEGAVRAFQEEFGILVDGIVGPDTYNAIGLGPEDEIEVPTEGYSIYIDTTNFTLTLNQNGSVINTYPVAVGAPSTPTPLGDWRIIQKTLNPGGPFGTRWMKINVPWGGYGIHGTDNPSSIGTAASHGCVRMYNEDVNELYDIVPLGTPVRIVGATFTGRILRPGVEPGEDIAEVQRILQMLGYYREGITGEYDSATEQAVMAFQRDFGLTPDGVVGPKTYEVLFRQRDITLGDIRP